MDEDCDTGLVRRLAELKKRHRKRRSERQAKAILDDEEYRDPSRRLRKCGFNPPVTSLPSQEDVEHLLREEKKDINAMSRHIPTKSHRPPQPLRLLDLEDESYICKYGNDEEYEELQPEVAAAIMHTEERGVKLGAPPRQIYNQLFQASREEPLLPVGSLAPCASRFKDVMIPLVPPTESSSHPTLEEAAVMAADHCFGVKDDVCSNFIKQPELHERLKYLLDCKKDNDPELWEGSTSCTSLSDFETLSEVKSPKCINRVQLRGSTLPSWFPGYFMILPNMEQPSLSQSPSQVMQSAWKAVHPETFEDKGRIFFGS
ncbi:uncharacterized protein LOC134528028 [Bacillus rossius redtenbacheri]|uniref:uncharacterized protein LOC134528028 n=1 Tax=Bacillus rossius redtenbacheri TaxID=93214 RepID=UPI002FDC919B